MSSIDHDLLRIGRIMAADQGLTIECRGMLAYAEPGKVVIPSLENLDYLGPDAERMMHGYLDHECAHASDSDFDLFEKAVKKSQAFKVLLNAVEDGYIEARQGRRYRGARWNLERKNTWFWEREAPDGRTVPRDIASPKTDAWTKLTLALTLCMRPYGSRTPEDFKALDADTYERLKLCTDEIAEVQALADTPRATAKCWEISERIYDRFAEESKGYQSAPARLLLKLAGWDGEAVNPEKAIEVELLAVLAGEDLGEGCDYDGKPISEAEGEGHNAEKPRGSKPYIVFSHEYDHEVDVTGDVRVSGKYEDLVNETAEAADAFVFAFEAALRARREKGTVYGCDEGDVDPYALSHFAVGSESADRLYSQQTAEEDDDDVVVSVLVDCSESMGSYDWANSKARLAAQAATAIHRACAACHIEHEITGFTTSYWPDPGAKSEDELIWQVDAKKLHAATRHLRSAWKSGQDPRNFARIFQGDDPAQLSYDQPPLCVPAHAIFKNFGSSDGRGISHITGVAENLDGEAVLWQARRLAERPERRRVMFVLSDGYPSAARYNTDEHGYLKETVARVIDAGIEVYGIGIMSTAVAEFYPIHWVARRLADLPEIAMGALTEILGQNRMEKRWVTI